MFGLGSAGSDVRVLSGNCNFSTVSLSTNNSNPRNVPIHVSGNCNLIRIRITEVDCPHGADCKSREADDDRVRVSGNCNRYDFEVTTYGTLPKEVFRLTGNMNDVRVVEKKTQPCSCAGRAPNPLPPQGAFATAQVPADAAQAAYPDDPPPAYAAPPPAPPAQDSRDNTKTLLMSSISSLDAFEDRG